MYAYIITNPPSHATSALVPVGSRCYLRAHFQPGLGVVTQLLTCGWVWRSSASNLMYTKLSNCSWTIACMEIRRVSESPVSTRLLGTTDCPPCRGFSARPEFPRINVALVMLPATSIRFFSRVVRISDYSRVTAGVPVPL